MKDNGSACISGTLEGKAGVVDCSLFPIPPDLEHAPLETQQLEHSSSAVTSSYCLREGTSFTQKRAVLLCISDDRGKVHICM